jgi:hypothetical protein
LIVAYCAPLQEAVFPTISVAGLGGGGAGAAYAAPTHVPATTAAAPKRVPHFTVLII